MEKNYISILSKLESIFHFLRDEQKLKSTFLFFLNPKAKFYYYLKITEFEIQFFKYRFITDIDFFFQEPNWNRKMYQGFSPRYVYTKKKVVIHYIITLALSKN